LVFALQWPLEESIDRRVSEPLGAISRHKRRAYGSELRMTEKKNRVATRLTKSRLN
jgi:hypothetical protein